jgi:hypothetical protein
VGVKTEKRKKKRKGDRLLRQSASFTGTDGRHGRLHCELCRAESGKERRKGGGKGAGKGSDGRFAGHRGGAADAVAPLRAVWRKRKKCKMEMC